MDTACSIAHVIAHKAVCTFLLLQKPCYYEEYIFPTWGCNLLTNTLAIQRYHIDVTDIGLRFSGYVGGLLYFGIADK